MEKKTRYTFCFSLAASSNSIFYNHSYLRTILVTVNNRSFMTSAKRKSGNFYQILGVSKTATQKEIKNAFYSLSKKYHPDMVGSNTTSAKKFLEIKEAYDTLKDENKRKEYDQYHMGMADYQNYPHMNRQHRRTASEQQHTYDNWHDWARRTHDQRHRSTNFDEEFARIWRMMQGNHEFQRANTRFNEEIRRMREEAYRRHMEARKHRAASWNGTTPQNDENVEKIQRQLTVERIIVIILMILFLLLVTSAGDSEFQPVNPHKELYYGDYNARNERERKKREEEISKQAIDEMVRRMP